MLRRGEPGSSHSSIGPTGPLGLGLGPEGGGAIRVGWVVRTAGPEGAGAGVGVTVVGCGGVRVAAGPAGPAGGAGAEVKLSETRTSLYVGCIFSMPLDGARHDTLRRVCSCL